MTVKIEGYWYSKYKPQYPMPVANATPFENKDEFLSQLSKLEERSLVRSYRGWSNCRICNKGNGSTEFEHRGWKWPAGYRHYIEDHNVVSSEEFFNFVMNT